MKIYLEFKDEKSEKFWEVTVEGNAHTVRYGKIGAKGTSKTKEFETPEKAEADATKLANAKKKKGYVAIGEDGAPLNDSQATKVATGKKTQTTKKTATPKETKPAMVGPEPKMLTYDEWEKLGKYFSFGKIANVIYFKGDLQLGQSLNAGWALKLLEKYNIDEDCLIHIDGNLTVDGDVYPSYDDFDIHLQVSGDLRCDELTSCDETIVINGDAYIKYFVIGYSNDGHLDIEGKTEVPFILNNNHSMSIEKEEGTLVLCMGAEDTLMEYDFIEEDFHDVMKKAVMVNGELDLEKVAKLIDKGDSPIKASAKTKKMALHDLITKNMKKAEKNGVLDLSGCKLEEFPTAILKLTDLKELNLSNNNFRIIPEEITKLTKLKILNLYSRNMMLPENIGELTNLEQLSCRYDYGYFPESIKKLQNLTHLSMVHAIDRYENITDRAFPEQVCKLKQLKHLYLSFLDFSNFPESFNQLTNLEYLSCARCFQDVQEIPKLTGLKKLKKADVEKAFGNPACIQEFFKIPTLTFLSIRSYGNLESDYLKGINKLSNLEHLNIAYNKLKTLHDDVYKLDKLKHLIADFNELSYDILFRLMETYPDATVVVNPVDNATVAQPADNMTEEQKSEYELLSKVRKKWWDLTRPYRVASEEEKLNQLFELGDYLYGELIPENASKYDSFSTFGRLAISNLKNVGNEIAWQASKIETDPERIEKAIKYVERSLAETSPTEDDFIRDSYVRILLKAGRVDEAYEVVHEVLSRKPDFSDFIDLKEDNEYQAWVKKNKQ